MHQLRWNAVLGQWVVVSTHRQGRPQMPANWCPFCPGSGHVPDHYDVYLYPNDFPAFSADAEPFEPETGLFAVTGARGACDVVLYSSNHTLPPSQLTVESWRKIVDLWALRTGQLAEDPDIAFVAPFENCGEAVGVTMPHPHGQIYAMPFVPFLSQREIAMASEFAAENQGRCLFCCLLEKETSDGIRIVARDRHFTALVPFAARFPAEIVIYSQRHVRTLMELDDAERTSLAETLSVVRQKYDNLYGFLMPLMMTVRQAPVKDSAAPYHFNIQFLPLQRSATKLKYLASIETGFGTFLADTSAEQMAESLRKAEPAT
jgi:UDPglucose--hexose-1-phosphate uridylyltransferase